MVCGSACPAGTGPKSSPALSVPSSPPVVVHDAGKPPRLRSTPGKIACGEKFCDLNSQVCCVGANSREWCAARPKDPSSDVCGKKALTKYCDGVEDCADGVCCRTSLCTGECPPMFACETPLCETEPGGVCLPGGICPKGYRCSQLPGEATGVCVLEAPGVDCGSRRCQGKTPVCCWNSEAQSASCEESCPGQGMGDFVELHCASRRDCGGYSCGKFSSSPAKIYGCAGHSFAGDRFLPILCSTVADCPRRHGDNPVACKRDETLKLPPNIKSCMWHQLARRPVDDVYFGPQEDKVD